MIDLKHPDGDALNAEFVEQWFQRKMDRLRAYWLLSDRERLVTETKRMLAALEDDRLSWEDL